MHLKVIRPYFMKDVASKMHTEQIDLIVGGDVGDGFLEEA